MQSFLSPFRRLVLFIATGLSFGIMLSGAPAALGQTFGLRYQIRVGTLDNQTQNSFYDSGLVQTNQLTAVLGDAGPFSTAYVTPHISFGTNRIFATIAVNNPIWDGNGRMAITGAGQPPVYFTDRLTIASPTLPTGTPVTVRFTLTSQGYVTPNAGNALDGLNSSAQARLSGFGNDINYSFGTTYATNSQTVTHTIGVGSTVSFTSAIQSLNATANSGSMAFSGTIQADLSTVLTVDVLTPQASYVADSGSIYPGISSSILPEPVQNIAFVGNTVTVSWPTNYFDYTLESNTNLLTGAWIPASETISILGTNFQISIIQPISAKFFRLRK